MRGSPLFGLDFQAGQERCRAALATGQRRGVCARVASGRYSPLPILHLPPPIAYWGG